MVPRMFPLLFFSVLLLLNPGGTGSWEVCSRKGKVKVCLSSWRKRKETSGHQKEWGRITEKGKLKITTAYELVSPSRQSVCIVTLNIMLNVLRTELQGKTTAQTLAGP